MNNIFDERGKGNFLFLASVIAALCENGPITLDLENIEKYWKGEIRELKYDMCAVGKAGSITFSLKKDSVK